MRVAVIGAGTSGICAAKHALQQGFGVTVFEQSGEVGGTWVYTDNVGKDEFGLDVHSSMYKGLHTNLPKEIMGYPDFPIPEQQKSYIPAEDILKFLNSYATEFKIRDHIRFHNHVLRIRPTVDNLWEIIVKELLTGTIKTYIFEFVLVCNGHYHTPAYAIYPGKENFKGKQIHSHDYKCPERFKDQTVLVIGAGPSGMDLALEISKVATKVTLSHHLQEKPKTVFPDNLTEKPDVVCLLENGAKFSDGTCQDFSMILYCTGYKYTFPFLSVDCGIYVDDNYVTPLYKHCINIKYPTMALIGLPFYVCACQMFDLQVRFVFKFFSRQKILPSTEEMLLDTNKEMQERWSKGYKKRQAHMMGPDQLKYYNDLATTAQIESLKPVMAKLHDESSLRFVDDLVNFRKDIFKIVDDETFVKIN